MRLKYLFALSGLLYTSVNAQTNNIVNKSHYIIDKLTKEHYAPIDWQKANDTVFINNILDELDDSKLYFTKDEADELKKLAADIKNHTSTNLQILYNKTFQYFKAANSRNLKFINDLQTTNIDLNKNDSIPADLKDYAGNVKELERRWQILLQEKVYSKLVKQLKLEKDKKINTTIKPTIAQINTAKQDVFKRYSKNFNYYNTDALIHEYLEDVFLNTVCLMYDPHSSYFNFDSHKEFEASTTANIFTCGVVVSKNKQNNYEIP